MKLMNKKSGFTLLEIIIVIIIVGVLASLALPRFFSTIEFSRSTEALNSLGVIRKSIERCGLVADTVAACTGWANIDMSDPGLEANAHYAYAITITNGANRQYNIVATRNAIDGGDGVSTVTLTVDGAAGTIVRSGTGSYSSIN